MDQRRRNNWTTGPLGATGPLGTNNDDDNDNDGIETVFLNGTLSTDAGGFIASHQWFEVTSLVGAVPIGSGEIPAVSFALGSHTIQLLVTDNEGGSTSDTVVVTVNQSLTNNQPPVANAGLDRIIADINGDNLRPFSSNLLVEIGGYHLLSSYEMIVVERETIDHQLELIDTKLLILATTLTEEQCDAQGRLE